MVQCNLNGQIAQPVDSHEVVCGMKRTADAQNGIALIGCGNMGYALLGGWMRGEQPADVQVVEPDAALRARAAAAGARAVDTLQAVDPSRVGVVVVAVKPQLVGGVLRGCGHVFGPATAYLSVAAGVTLSAMKEALPQGAALIRCMPNTPASVWQGMLVLCADAAVDARTRVRAQSLMESCGIVAWIDDEDQMDAVTAISGSGPAYVFHFAEALTEAGRDLGLPDDIAALLARQTVVGAAAMLRDGEAPPAELRGNVTSPGGTTAAALQVLMPELSGLIARAARAARDRSRELGA